MAPPGAGWGCGILQGVTAKTTTLLREAARMPFPVMLFTAYVVGYAAGSIASVAWTLTHRRKGAA